MFACADRREEKRTDGGEGRVHYIMAKTIPLLSVSYGTARAKGGATGFLLEPCLRHPPVHSSLEVLTGIDPLQRRSRNRPELSRSVLRRLSRVLQSR